MLHSHTYINHLVKYCKYSEVDVIPRYFEYIKWSRGGYMSICGPRSESLLSEFSSLIQWAWQDLLKWHRQLHLHSPANNNTWAQFYGVSICVCNSLSVYLSIYLSICHSIDLSINQWINLSIYLSLSISPSICISISIIYIYIYIYIYSYSYIYIYLSIYLSISICHSIDLSICHSF